MLFLQAINSDLSVLRVCNKTGGTIKGDIKKIFVFLLFELEMGVPDHFVDIKPLSCLESDSNISILKGIVLLDYVAFCNTKCLQSFFLLSPKMLQSVRRHSAIVLTVTVNCM